MASLEASRWRRRRQRRFRRRLPLSLWEAGSHEVDEESRTRLSSQHLLAKEINANIRRRLQGSIYALNQATLKKIAFHLVLLGSILDKIGWPTAQQGT
ncbi:unnamed protein product [Urochloa humidicola]